MLIISVDIVELFKIVLVVSLDNLLNLSFELILQIVKIMV